MKILSRINAALLRFFTGTIAIINISIVLMILAGAFVRDVLKKDFYGLEELVLMIAFWMYFLGSAVATYEGSQVSADLVSSFAKTEKARAVLTLIRTVITLFLFGILMVWAANYVSWSAAMRPTTAVFKIPMLVSHVSLLISFVLSVLYETMHLTTAVLALRSAFKPQINGGAA